MLLMNLHLADQILTLLRAYNLPENGTANERKLRLSRFIEIAREVFLSRTHEVTEKGFYRGEISISAVLHKNHGLQKQDPRTSESKILSVKYR